MGGWGIPSCEGVDEWAREEATQEANARDSKGAGEKGGKEEGVCSRKIYPLEAEAPQFYERERVQKLAQAYYERPSPRKKEGGGNVRGIILERTTKGFSIVGNFFFWTKLIASHTWKNSHEKSSFFISKTSSRDNHKKKQIKTSLARIQNLIPRQEKVDTETKTSKKIPVLRFKDKRAKKGDRVLETNKPAF